MDSWLCKLLDLHANLICQDKDPDQQWELEARFCSQIIWHNTPIEVGRAEADIHRMELHNSEGGFWTGDILRRVPHFHEKCLPIKKQGRCVIRQPGGFSHICWSDLQPVGLPFRHIQDKHSERTLQGHQVHDHCQVLAAEVFQAGHDSQPHERAYCRQHKLDHVWERQKFCGKTSQEELSLMILCLTLLSFHYSLAHHFKATVW